MLSIDTCIYKMSIFVPNKKKIVFNRILSLALIIFMLIFSNGFIVFKHVCYSSGQVIVTLLEKNASCNKNGEPDNCHIPESKQDISCCKSSSHCHIEKATCCRTYFQYLKLKSEYESGKKLLISNIPKVTLTPVILLSQPSFISHCIEPDILKQKVPDAGRKLILKLHQFKIPSPEIS